MSRIDIHGEGNRRAESMKLSEAIREGAKLRPQGFGAFFTTDEDDKTCSCAVGAAIEALTGKTHVHDEEVAATIREGWELFKSARIAPGGAYHDWLPRLLDISKRNDIRHHTREQIADWLSEQGY
jgi:hypothetical protein